jgi:hypothetical protein
MNPAINNIDYFVAELLQEKLQNKSGIVGNLNGTK